MLQRGDGRGTQLVSGYPPVYTARRGGTSWAWTGHIYKGRMDTRLPDLLNKDSECPDGPEAPGPCLGPAGSSGSWRPLAPLGATRLQLASSSSTSLTPNAPRSVFAEGGQLPSLSQSAGMSWPHLFWPGFIRRLSPQLSHLGLCSQHHPFFKTLPEPLPLCEPLVFWNVPFQLAILDVLVTSLWVWTGVYASSSHFLPNCKPRVRSHLSTWHVRLLYVGKIFE